MVSPVVVTCLRRLWLLVAVLAGMPSASAWSQDLPAIVARINGTAVTRAQFEARLAQSRSMNPERFDHMTAVERNRACSGR